jgi:hypothetical protein
MRQQPKDGLHASGDHPQHGMTRERDKSLPHTVMLTDPFGAFESLRSR